MVVIESFSVTLLSRHFRVIARRAKLLNANVFRLFWTHENNSVYTVRRVHIRLPLKVPKRENFSFAFFALSEPIWVCDLGTGPKNPFFYHLTPDCEHFWFFAAY